MEAALEGAGEIGFTIVSITLSLIAVFIPLFLMGGYIGKLFQEFAVAVSVALVLSLADLAHADADAVLAPAARTRAASATDGSTGRSNAVSTAWSEPMSAV